MTYAIFSKYRILYGLIQYEQHERFQGNCILSIVSNIYFNDFMFIKRNI